MKTILFLFGPNLNALGKRDPSKYGTLDYAGLCAALRAACGERGIAAVFYQTNHEGAIIDRLQEDNYDAVVLNAGAYSHTSYAIRDALETVAVPRMEVHLSDVKNREPWRAVSVLTEVCDGEFHGKKLESYREAVAAVVSAWEARL
ncbi:MAG: 3-dehydroquinate dehydratase [Clostridiales bacterium]|jgi:3-dehydroquinate dehydratase-2|nr:3-dehydroquinate dehydratase [Clostridiales bacterium]